MPDRLHTSLDDAGASAPGHAVQFYEDDAFLHGVVADFLEAGLQSSQPVVVIATALNREGFADRLMACGHDVAALERTGQLTMADANETLAAFMVGQLPDADLFRQKIGGLLDVATGGRLDVTVRAYGEMVNELWRDGNPEGAIRLEALWNELFSLLCGYAIGNFYREAHVTGFHDVCSQHAHVLPTEGYPTSADEGSRLREIAKLQPDRDGYGMIHAIRTHPSADVRAIRAIAVPSYAGDHYRARAISAGYDEYIAKPVEPARLTQVVSDLIRRHPRAHAAT